MRTTLCLIVFNEKKGCEADVPHLPRAIFDDVYAVDGGSTDGTVEYLTDQEIPVHRQPKPSLNAAYIHAVDLCKTERLVVFFPKGTLDPSCCEVMFEKLMEGYALVVPSRNMPGGYNEEDEKLFRPRKWGVASLSLIAAALWRREGCFIHDVLHGVKGFEVAAFRQMHIADAGVTVDLEMVVRAYQLRLSRFEFPVTETPRLTGKSNFPIWRTGQRLALFLILELLRKRS